MSFLSVLIALLLEQARPLGPGNSIHHSIRVWVRWCAKNFDAGKSSHGWLAWGFAVGGPSLLVLLIYWLLQVLVGWPLALIWSVAVLYATLGFRQFSVHFTQIRDALTDGDEELARQLLADWQQIDARDLPRSEIVRHVIEHSVLAAHRHVFGVLTWYCVLAAFGLGPAGAVLYRLSEFVARYWQHKSKTQHQPMSDALQHIGKTAWAVVDWVPARITAVSFAVVGSFEDAIDGWRNQELRFSDDSDGVVLAATSGAVNIQLGGPTIPTSLQPTSTDTSSVPLALPPRQTPEIAHFPVIVGLVWRTVVMWMVLLALLTLARLLG